MQGHERIRTVWTARQIAGSLMQMTRELCIERLLYYNL